MRDFFTVWAINPLKNAWMCRSGLPLQCRPSPATTDKRAPTGHFCGGDGGGQQDGWNAGVGRFQSRNHSAELLLWNINEYSGYIFLGIFCDCYFLLLFFFPRLNSFFQRGNRLKTMCAFFPSTLGEELSMFLFQHHFFFHKCWGVHLKLHKE